MTTFLSTLGWGFAALLAVAVAVAALEHAVAKVRKANRLPPPAPRRAASLDVDLGHLTEDGAPPTGDQAQRAATLDGALGRMGTPPAPAPRPAGQAWTETQPMVAASLQVELPADHAEDHARR